MEASGKPVVSTRLKREDCKTTKHDSAFTEWKILIGPSDWEDHLLGKEGVERYRTQNLPNSSSCPGIYELGVVVSRPRSGREVGKLDPDFIIPVYLGQADNVRTRIQRYGREGAHLENSNSFVEGLGLFKEIFSRGFSIVYRWAPMKNKRDAEKTEAQLLDKFDYAWNKGSNGVRRPDDILQKLDRSTSSASLFPRIARKLQIFPRKQMGVKIQGCQPLLLENGSSIYTNQENSYLFSRIFKFGSSQPRLVSMGFGPNKNHITICGVALGQGSVCIRPPVWGRKRCAEHKGMKINGSTPKSITDGKSPAVDVSMGSGIIIEPECNDGLDNKFSYSSTPKLQLTAGKHSVKEEFSPICGVVLYDGTPCTREPIQRNRRCEEHKGRRICGPVSKTVTEKEHYVNGPVLGHEQIPTGACKPGRKQSPVSFGGSGINKDCEIICGVHLEDGTFCTRWPVVGRKRCEEHKGMRVKPPISKLLEAEIPSVFDDSAIIRTQKCSNTSARSASYGSVFNDDFSPTCGATLVNGSFCRRKPSEGNKRCWQHKSMRADNTSSKIDSCSNWKYSGVSFQSVSYKGEDFSSTCGAPLSNGSYCSRTPANGRKRCWQHKGMRVS